MVITAALYYLAKYPECQEKVQQEVDEIFGNNVTLQNSDQLKELTYLDQFICETLRLWVR